jgi:SAM-dependent methyltransferase
MHAAGPAFGRPLIAKPFGGRVHMTSETTSWELFFDAHASVYMDNVFTKNTIREVDFLLEELGLQPGSSILDVGCGTGRHSIELAKRGYAVTGLDLSQEMLAQAEQGAKVAGVKVNWIRSDAARFSLAEKYDAVICLCEGSMGLLSQTDDPIDQPLAILRNISQSLKAQAHAILTVLNGAAMIRRCTNDDVRKGRFDPLQMVESSAHSPREGLPAIPVRERAFVPTELVLMCDLAGLSVLSMWGGTAGNWGRRELDLDEIEIMVVACKTAETATRLSSARIGGTDYSIPSPASRTPRGRASDVRP